MTREPSAPKGQTSEQYSRTRRSFSPKTNLSLKRASMGEDTDPMQAVVRQYDAKPALSTRPPRWEVLHRSKIFLMVMAIGIGFTVVIFIIFLLISHSHATLITTAISKVTVTSSSRTPATATLQPTSNITGTAAPPVVIGLPTASPVSSPTALPTVQPTFTSTPLPTATPQPIIASIYIAANTPPPGTNTGISLTVGAKVTITAYGLATYSTPVVKSVCDKYPYYSDPDGNLYANSNKSPQCPSRYDPGAVASTIPVGTLIGRIDNGNWFRVGSAANFIAPQNGSLFLLYNDANNIPFYNDNTGGYNVNLHVQP